MLLTARARGELQSALGPSLGALLHQLANGIDPRPLETERRPKSESRETTFAEDIGDKAVLGDPDPDQADRGVELEALAAARARPPRHAPASRVGEGRVRDRVKVRKGRSRIFIVTVRPL